MKSFAIFAFAVIALLAGSKGLAQDEVKYFDRATQKEVSVRGTIQEEKPSQIVIKGTTGAAKQIPAVDVIDVSYLSRTPASIRFEYRNADLKVVSVNNPQTAPDARKKAANDALTTFKKIAAEPGLDSKIKRQFEFK